MKILIRQISGEDAITVTMLCQQLGYDLPVEQIRENIRIVTEHSDHDAFVAVHEEKVVGWIGVSQAFQIENEPYCEIRGLIVDDSLRNKGLGKMLVEKARQWGKEKGNKLLRVRCNRKRMQTHLFYEHLGFKEIKEQKVFEINTGLLRG